MTKIEIKDEIKEKAVVEDGRIIAQKEEKIFDKNKK